jgi:hypothetical protein
VTDGLPSKTAASINLHEFWFKNLIFYTSRDIVPSVISTRRWRCISGTFFLHPSSLAGAKTMPGINLDDRGAWDDSALVDSWDEAVAEYQVNHRLSYA